jgi:uncharacterized lipoprotein YbaY
MKLTDKKVSQLIDHIAYEISFYQDLIDAGHTEYMHNRVTLNDTLDYIKDLFDVEVNNDNQ